VLNFIRARLDQQDQVLTADFNPWLFSSTQELLTQFFDLIGGLLEVRLKKKREDLGRILAAVGSVASVASVAVPGVSVNPGQAMSNIGQLLTDPNIQEMRDRVADALGSAGKRVVVLIDDIDRLDVEETYLLFRLIKLVAGFKNTSYVLAFDRRVVAASLARRYPEQEEAGDSFIEKIIQVPLDLPPARLDLVHGVVFEGIDDLLREERIELDQEAVARFRLSFDRDLGPDFRTPRAANRYLNALRFAVPCLGQEVDVVDLLLLEGVRTCMPKLYTWLSANKPLLTLPALRLGGSVDQGTVDSLNTSLNMVETHRQARAKSLVESLFPIVQGIWGNTLWGEGNWSDAWASHRRAASAEYFDRFFAYSVPPGDVAEGVVDDIVDRASTGEDVAERIAELFDDGRASPLLAKLQLRLESLPQTALPGLVTAITAASDRLDLSDERVFSLSTAERAALLIASLVTGVEQEEERSALALSVARAAEPLGMAMEIYRWASRTGDDIASLAPGVLEAMDEELAARIVDADKGNPLFVSDPEAAPRLYGLVLRSERATELGQQVLAHVKTATDATTLIRAYMTRTTDMETGRRGRAPLDANSLEALSALVDPQVLLALVTAEHADFVPNPDVVEIYGDDPTSIACNYILLMGRTNAKE
jgi:hypothetical protein